TLGAVAGCVFSTFFLLELYGTQTTLWLAAALNVLIAVVARTIDRHATGAMEREPFRRAAVRSAESLALQASAVPELDPPANPAFPARPTFLLLASGTVGFAFFLMELVWYRMLAPLLGGSVFTFGLVLAIALAGIGLGGLLYAIIASDKPASLSGFVWTCLLEAVAIAGTFALGDRVAVLALTLLPLASV